MAQKVKKGTHSDVPVSSVDFLPTIMHLAGKKDKQRNLKMVEVSNIYYSKTIKSPLKEKLMA